jgi:hypothetical protein
MKRLLILAFFLFISLQAFQAYAATYTWSRNGGAAYSSATAACSAFAASQPHQEKFGIAVTQNLSFSTPSQAICSGRYMNSGISQVYSTILYRIGDSCPVGSSYDSTIGGCEIPPPPVCTSDTIPGFGLYGANPTGDIITIGDTGPRIANVNSCAYTCYVNYDLLDGFTTFGAAHQCTGLSQPYVDQEPSSYTDPAVCSVRDNLGRCLELSAQTGACPAGTTYGRVNDINVCVPSGTSTAATDTGSTGVPDAGGSQQATGTADVAGTGGLSTGSGTSTSTSSSTTTVNPDGTSTTEGTETEESAGPKTFGGHGDPKSWWVSKYPAGVSGIADNFSYSVQTSAIMDVLNPLTSLPNSGSEPVWSMSFNLGPLGNYGVSDFRVPEGVWLFVRFCLFFTATFVAQRIVFGGG